jgi:hypothetical protein
MTRLAGAAWLMGVAYGQAPDVRLNVNAVVSYQAYDQGAAALRFYDVLGQCWGKQAPFSSRSTLKANIASL